MMKHSILVVTRNQREYQQRLSELYLAGASIDAPESEEGIAARIADADILLGDSPLLARWISRAGACRWLQSTFAGVDALMEDGLPRSYLLTNVKDTYGDCMAEYVLAYLLYFERRIGEHLLLQAKREWRQAPFEPLSQRRLGVLGTGSIGTRIAQKAKAFGLQTVGIRREARAAEGFDVVYASDALGEAFAELDYLVSVLPHTEETKHILNAASIGLLPQRAVLLNIGRGSAVDTQALAVALREGRLRAAVLDVFDEEPLAADSELWALPNVFITPHVSGYQINDRIFDIFQENYRRFCAGEPLLYQIDFEKGY